EQLTANNTGVCVNVAVGYGGRQEIVDAVRDTVAELAADGTPAEKIAEKITVDSLGNHMYTKGQPDPDLVIRTSGEQRLPGFLLPQPAHSETWPADTYWPASRRARSHRSQREYSVRHRPLRLSFRAVRGG